MPILCDEPQITLQQGSAPRWESRPTEKAKSSRSDEAGEINGNTAERPPLTGTASRHTDAGDGLGLPIIGKLLGHSQPSTTRRYAHLDSDPLRRASERITGAITAALDKQPDFDKERKNGSTSEVSYGRR
jgi:hypothetical protein